LVFERPVRGVFQKKRITGGKSEMTYITGDKTLLTLFLSLVPGVILPENLAADEKTEL